MISTLVAGRWYFYQGERVKFVGFGEESEDDPCFGYYNFETSDGNTMTLTHSDIADISPA